MDKAYTDTIGNIYIVEKDFNVYLVNTDTMCYSILTEKVFETIFNNFELLGEL